MSSIVVESNIETDGKLIISNKEEIKYDNISTLNFDGILTLNNNAKTKFNTTFIATPTIENKNIAGGVSEEESETKSGDLPEGLKLIAKSDCKTCHNKNLQTIGPAYTAIAKNIKIHLKISQCWRKSEEWRFRNLGRTGNDPTSRSG